MITKFEKFNEGIKHLLVGPTEEEFWDTIKSLHPTEKLRKSISAEYLYGINYALNHGAEIKELGHFSLKLLLRVLYDNNQTELLFKCIDDYFIKKDDYLYYFLFSCMYGYLKGVQDNIIKYKVDASYQNYNGLELAVKYNNLNIVDFLITHFGYTSSGYYWESRAKQFAEKYSNREVLDYFIKKGGN